MTFVSTENTIRILRTRCLSFILGTRSHDMWPPEVGAKPNAMTSAEVLCAMAAEIYAQETERYEPLRQIASLQLSDGSWTDPNDPDPWDCSATAWCVWALGGERFQEVRRKGLSFLASQIQNDDGTSTSRKHNIGNTYASAYALRCFVRDGHAKDADRVTRFLGASQNDDGGWGLTHRDPSDATLTMYVLDGLLEYGTSRTQIDRALSWLTQIRSSEGTFSSWLENGPSVEGTAFGLHILRKAGLPHSRIDDQALDYLRARTESNDGFAINGLRKVWVAVSVYLASAATMRSQRKQ